MGLVTGKYLLIFALMLLCAYASAQINSDFNGNAQGWTTPNDADATITYNAAGGNPGGNVSGSPFFIVLGAGTVYLYFYYVAPGAYTGNRSGYFDGTLRFDLQQSTTNTSVVHAEVIITNGATSLYYYPAAPFQPPATPAWTTFSVAMNEDAGFWKTTDDPAGPAATEAQIRAVLINLTGLQIRGLFRDANTTSRLDNVTFMPPIVITTQPASTAVCDGVTATLTTAATGNAAITYQWQRETTPGVWTNVTNTGGYGGATTPSLTINTTGNFGAGVYRGRVSGTAANDVFTNTATVTVNALPTAPTVTGSSACVTGSQILTAAGGAAGQYRWYTVPTGGTAIAGQTNSTYTTPSISVTTIYYVAINNGTCQSTRTAVTAAINAPPTAPTTTGGASCLPGSVTLSASGGTAGQYRWYTVPAAGTPLAGEVNSTYLSPVLSTTTTYYVAINNGTCESTRTAVVATIATPGCDNHPPDIQPVPVTTQIEGIITLNLVDHISDSDNNLDLSTLTIVSPPSSGATATIDKDFNLIINYAGLSFTGTETLTLQVCDSLKACIQQAFSIDVVGEIEIFNAVSPNKDGKNDLFFIKNIEKLDDTRKNHVTIFNRWGDLVWEGFNYDNTAVAFSGKSKNSDDLPSGTYYYKIEFSGGRKARTGYLGLRR